MSAILGLIAPPAVILMTWTVTQLRARKSKRVEKSQLDRAGNSNEAK